MRLISWNVNGLRAILKKGELQDLIKEWEPDVLCLQETKAKKGQAEVDLVEYEEIWNDAKKAGYSGTAIWTKMSPLRSWKGFSGLVVENNLWNLDGFGDAREEGRLLTAEYEQFYLVDVYVPNAKPDDGLLDLVLVRPVKKWQIGALLALYVPGLYVKTPLAKVRRVRTLEIACPGMTVNLDGELKPCDRARFEILPAALRVRLPGLAPERRVAE